MAYLYPIKINREPQLIRYDEEKELDGPSLYLTDFAFIGSDPFSITELPFGRYLISIGRTRLETDEEHSNRVQGEENYMAEYNKRHGIN